MSHLALPRRSSLLVAFALTIVSCGPRYSVIGDQASARGDWKRAHENYVLALEQEADSAELRTKLQNAKKQAIAHAIATARTCEIEHDSICVEREARFVLQHDPGNEAVAQARWNARADLAQRALAAGRAAAARGDFVESVRLASEATEWRKDDAGRSAASDMLKDVAPEAVAWAKTTVEAQDPAADRAVERLKGILAVLTATLPYVSNEASLLEVARGKLAEADAIGRARAAEAAAREAAERTAREVAQARATADRSRLVSVVGALVNPTKQNRKDWDGIGATNAARAARVAASLAVEINGGGNLVGEVAGGVAAALAEPVADATSLPEVFGGVELFVGRQSSGMVPINKTENSLTPAWSHLRWANVDIRNARLRLTLFDQDLQNHDPIGVVEIGPGDFAQALDSGRVWWVRVDEQSQGQLLYVGLSVQ